MEPLLIVCRSDKALAVKKAFLQYPQLYENVGLDIIPLEYTPKNLSKVSTFDGDYSALIKKGQQELIAFHRKIKSHGGRGDYWISITTGVVHHTFEPHSRQVPLLTSLALVGRAGSTAIGLGPSVLASARMQEEPKLEGLIDKVTQGQIISETADYMAVTMALALIISPEWYKLREYVK
ncbi:MAG TPA: hypothetical protein VJC39_04905 [Candidatus Nanoarchaeia archaeon]|nr:hypothetical protein [Candidatus Nanoarchaeia archaeon]